VVFDVQTYGKTAMMFDFHFLFLILFGQMYARKKNTILFDFSFLIFQKFYWVKCLPEVNWLKAAAVAFAGINFLGKQAGRPGEWQLVEKIHIKLTYLYV
jgi:hypothetical protein